MTDFSQFDKEEAPASSDSALKRLVSMANEFIETELQIEALEESLKDLNSRANHLKTVEMPDLMAECGLTQIKTDKGPVIELKDFVQGTLPKEPIRRKAAIDWLSENGAADLIKNEVSVEFGKTEHNVAKALAEDLRQRGLDVQEQESIHPQSLLAFARERLRAGEEIPLETIGLFSGRTCKVKGGKK